MKGNRVCIGQDCSSGEDPSRVDQTKCKMRLWSHPCTDSDYAKQQGSRRRRQLLLQIHLSIKLSLLFNQVN
jgi:hypothetical protein